MKPTKHRELTRPWPHCVAVGLLALALPALAQVEDLNALGPEDFQPVAVTEPVSRSGEVPHFPKTARQKAFAGIGAGLGNAFYEIAEPAPVAESFGFTEIAEAAEPSPFGAQPSQKEMPSPALWKWAAGAAGLAGALGMGYLLMEPESEKPKTNVYTFSDQTP